jgi:hypothetical protein
MKDGITHTLECLLHECDVIVRVSPYVIQLTEQKPDDDSPQKFQVRARFTVREKRPGKTQGEWIKTDHAVYEEEFDNRFDTDREWQGLTDEEIDWLWGLAFEAKLNNMPRHFARMVEEKLKEKNT